MVGSSIHEEWLLMVTSGMPAGLSITAARRRSKFFVCTREPSPERETQESPVWYRLTCCRHSLINALHSSWVVVMQTKEEALHGRRIFLGNGQSRVDMFTYNWHTPPTHPLYCKSPYLFSVFCSTWHAWATHDLNGGRAFVRDFLYCRQSISSGFSEIDLWVWKHYNSCKDLIMESKPSVAVLISNVVITILYSSS